MRLSSVELLIERLAGKTWRDPRLNWMNKISPEEARRRLTQKAGQDFGSSPAKWRKWWNDTGQAAQQTKIQAEIEKQDE